MKKIISLSIFCLFTSTVILAQTWPPVYEIKNDTASFQLLDTGYYQILEDKEGKWTFEDVLKPALADKFHRKGIKVDGIDTNAMHTYWRRYRLKNVMNTIARISVVSNMEFFEVFIKKTDSPWIEYKTGFLRGWSRKDGLKAAGPGVIPLALSPGEEVLVYDRRNSIQNANYKSEVRLVSTEKIIQKAYVDYAHTEGRYYALLELTEAFMIGFLFVAFFYNLIFFRIVREPVYLYFSLFILFLAIIRLWNISDSYLQRELPVLWRYVPLLAYSWAFIYFFLIQFVRYFFKTFIKYKIWDKCLFISAIIWVLLNIVSLVTQFYFEQVFSGIRDVWQFATKIIPLLLLTTLFLFVKKPEKLNRYVILGASPMLFLYGVLGWVDEDKESPVFPGFFRWLNGGNFRMVETICVLWFVLFFSLILFMRYNTMRKENAQKQLENERLAKEKEIEKNELIEQQKIQLEKDVAERTAELKQSLQDLQLSQSQLIQSEKMASLGELTAGIAHEIQNPLNFVNNFSDVNKELLIEMKDELDKGNIDGGKAIANDVIENEEKINHHGKRADAIVKGMLQHSRSSSGVKEPTDINALTDEYLRLAYHGLRAKDKSFNATMKTDFDESIGNINIIPQDIGRVILNLITNAFYAVTEKEKQNIEGYMPTVTVRTSRNPPPAGGGRGAEVLISVEDNGNGIPQKVLDKIFQPFFTTKPTGQGTGLGLSLSYDIVTKGHGGELKVETKEGIGSTFIIILPVI